MSSGAALVPADLSHEVNEAGQTLVLTGSCVLAVVAIVLAVRLARREQSLVPLFVIVGGALCTFLEPIYDATFHLFFYTEGQWNTYTSFGSAQPAWVLPTYIWFDGGLALFVYGRVRRGDNRRAIAKLALTMFAFATVFEIIGINLGTYEYYGPQPFVVADFPVWVSTINGFLPAVVGIVLAAVRPHLRGPHAVLAAALPPLGFGLLAFGGAWPALVILNTEDPATALTYLGGGAAMALCGVILWFACLTVSPVGTRPSAEERDSPDRSAGTREPAVQGAER